MEINEKTINNFKQNKIKYLVRDFEEYGVPENITREILLKRGVNKWFMCRSKIIDLKDELLGCIRFYLDVMKIIANTKGKNSLLYREILGRLRATNEIRQKIREICHLSRWQFPE